MAHLFFLCLFCLSTSFSVIYLSFLSFLLLTFFVMEHIYMLVPLLFLFLFFFIDGKDNDCT
ncbi:hypothetical protein QBC46DRAFT_168678 [Diplogelasinospora grovesii]|uniref:Uncharacterized protein n=1 Tax=Diplogelasinospora grovesii TaxID=303347 RepID=A0AAN6S331_9PEZI|nr:hypothetical protein QBC46DRAFT_168678 [Diplogelasinospora grovesii]